jgi:hypothetical protein
VTPAAPAAAPWLPPWLSFLSGLPEPARKRRLLMPVQVYCDESGHHGGGRHFVMAGLIAHAEHWAAFSDEWDAVLRETPAVPGVFKMKDAAGRPTGNFYGFSRKERDDKLRLLCRVINRYVQIATHSIIDMDAYALTWAKLPAPNRNVYFWPFQNSILAACFHLWDNGWRERFEIIFDEQLKFGPKAKAWYPIVKEVGLIKEPEASQILPVEPIFRRDDDALPIQAADMFAWCWRKKCDDPSFNEIDWLLGELPDVRQTDYSQYYDLEQMQSVMKMTFDNLKAGVPAHIVEKARQIEKKRT